MASRLVSAGHDVTVWNRTALRAEHLADAGASVASTPAGAVAGVDFAITMLATPEALDDVLFGTDGLASALSSGQTLIDMSTVGPDAFRSAAAGLPAGVVAIDAPVRGSIPEAIDGHLHVYLGASDEDFERARPVLEVFGDVHQVGGAGARGAL
jgi:3-hydroxyisobutyrate dehydrogenase